MAKTRKTRLKTTTKAEISEQRQPTHQQQSESQTSLNVGELLRSTDGSAQAHAARLNDPRLSASQRQAMAAEIGRLGGNQHLQRVLAHADVTNNPTVQRVDETGPYGMSTMYGTFMVYPDNFVGPLPVNPRGAESWSIRQSDYDQLVSRLSEVESNSSQLHVNGTPEFKLQVMLDLGWLMTSGVGQELIAEIQAAEHTVTIVHRPGGGNACGYDSDDSFELPQSPPAPGPGSNATVYYNPAVLSIGDGTLDWHHRPPAIGLAHELIHAWTAVYGMRARLTDEAGVNRRELQATGLGEFANNRITENRFRAAFGLPHRPEY